MLFVPGSETGDGFLDVHFAAGKLRFLCHVEERYTAPTGELHGLEIYNRHTDSTDEKEFERWFSAAMKNPEEWKRIGADLARYPDEISPRRPTTGRRSLPSGTGTRKPIG